MPSRTDSKALTQLSIQQWQQNVLGAKKLHKHAKFYISTLAIATFLIDGAAIIAGGNYITLESHNKFLFGAVSVSALIKCGGTVLPKIRQWALDKIKSEGKELEGLSDPEALEIRENLHKITVIASTDKSNFKQQIQSLWPLLAAVAAGSFDPPYNYLSSTLAALGSLSYIAHGSYLFCQSAHKADTLFKKLESKAINA